MKSKIIIISSLLLLGSLFSSCIDEEKVLYDSIKNKNTAKLYQEYIDKYPDGKYKTEINDSLQVRLKEKENNAFLKAKETNSLLSYSEFIKTYSKSKFTGEVNDSIYFLKELAAYNNAVQTKELAYFKIIQDSFPKGRYLEKAKYYIDSIGTVLAKLEEENEKERLKQEQTRREQEKFKNKAGTFVDKRDGHTYKWVRIGKQIWMAENLAYKPISGKYCITFNNPNNLSKYGYLYGWETAKRACPKGWHLPSKNEWMTLFNKLGGVEIAAKKMKTKTGWEKDNFYKQGTNESLFNALPAGLSHDFSSDGVGSSFLGENYVAYFWSSTKEQYSIFTPWLLNSEDYIKLSGQSREGISVRCVKNK